MAKDKKGKKPKKNKPTSKKYLRYSIDGEKISKGKSCLKCGPGVFMMESANRFYCGRCHYTEFTKKENKD